MKTVLLALAVMAADTPAAPSPGAETPIDVIGQKSKEKRIVCKTSAPTGSLFQRRDCRSQADWERATAKAKVDYDRAMQGMAEDQAAREQSCLNLGRC